MAATNEIQNDNLRIAPLLILSPEAQAPEQLYGSNQIQLFEKQLYLL
jgi:hypothetical protein